MSLRVDNCTRFGNGSEPTPYAHMYVLLCGMRRCAGYLESTMHGMVLQVEEGEGEGLGLETANKTEGEPRQKWNFADVE